MTENGECSTFSEFERHLNEVKDRSVFEALHGGNKIILGVRAVKNTQANSGPGRYDDQFVLMWYDGTVGYARSFPGNTGPSAFQKDAGAGVAHISRKAAMGADAHGDGDVHLDLGRISPGVYRYRKGTSRSLGDRVLRLVHSINAEAHVTHDEAFDEQDSASFVDDKVNSVWDSLFHPDLPDRIGSARGQTMSPEVYEQFWAALGDQDDFVYILVEM